MAENETVTSEKVSEAGMQALAIISGLIPVVNNLILLIAKWRDAAKQSKELTPEQEAALDAQLDTMFKSAHWLVQD